MMSSIGSMEKAFTKTFHINFIVMATITNMTAKKVPIFLYSLHTSKIRQSGIKSKKKKKTSLNLGKSRQNPA